MENKVQNTSPNYDQQLEEIELLQNILLQKLTIIQSEPNFIIQLEIEGDNPEEEEPFKTFYLEITLNNNYPDKQPRLKFYEVNDYLNEKRKENILKKLNDYCEENIGIPIIYQLYEIAKEFVDEEEKNCLREKKEKMRGKINYKLNFLNKIKQIKYNDTYPVDIFNIKGENILVVFENGLIKVYDKFQNIIFELLKENTSLPIIFAKHFDFSNMLYLFNCKSLLIYEIIYLSKKNVYEEYKYKINGKIKINFLYIYETSDVIEFPAHPDSFFLIQNEDDKFSLKEYYKKNFLQLISQHDYDTPFFKLHYINEDKFIMASYTLRKKGGDIQGKNEMCLMHSDNFKINKKYNIKISPLNNSITTFKNKYLIISYFETYKKEDEKENDPYYIFNDNFYNSIFHCNIYNYYEEDYHNYNVSFYSYDIKQHFIGIYSINYEEFVTKIEYDLIKCIYNLKDCLLCEFVQKGKTNKNTQVSYERNFHGYYNDIPLGESNDADNYKTQKYLGYISLDNGIIELESKIDYDEITSFKEINKNSLVICSEKKGIVFYN